MPLPTIPKQPKAIDPAAQSSLMGAIGRGTMSGIASAANMLSKPSRALWGSANFLTGGNSGGGLLNLIPFSDTMGLTDPNQGVELSKFLGDQGLMSQNDESKWEWMDPVRGVVDIAGDPLSWLGPGALTKAGTSAAKAGKLTKGFVPSIRSGERAIVGLQLPFATKPFATVGSGAGVADGLEAAGRVASKVPGVTAAANATGKAYRTGRAMFDNSVRGAMTKAGQSDFYEGLTKAQKKAKHAIQARLNTVAETLSDAGLDSPMNAENLRHALETGRWLHPPHQVELEAVKSLDKLRKDLFKMQKRGGMHVEKLMDEAGIDYWFRQTPDSGKGSAGSIGRSGPGTAGDKSAVRRNLMFRGFKEGTHGINKLFTDDDLFKFIDDLKMSGVTKRKDQVSAVSSYIAQKYGNDILQDAPVYTKRGKPVFQRDPTTGAILKDAAGNPLQEVANRYDLLADALTGDSARQWKARGGVFTNHPIADALKLGSSRAERAPIGEYLSKTLAKHAKAPVKNAGAPSGTGGMRVGDIVKTLNQGKVGLDAVEIAKKIHEIRSPGVPFTKKARKAILIETVDDDLAADLVKNWDKYTAPPSVGPVTKAFDSASALWKAGMLAWPGRITRDLTSSVARMGEQGWLGAGGGLVDASKILRGQTVDGLEKIPAIEKFLYDNAMDVTPENAQRAYNAMYQARYGRSNVMGSGAAVPTGTTLDDITGQLPGQIEQTYPQMFGDAARLLVGQNPATKKFEAKRFWPTNVRNVGGATESTFGPAAASDLLGGHADDLTRMASDLDHLRKGYEPEVAAQNVNSAFADYSLDSLTPTEQQIRRALPFYNFCVPVDHEILTRDGWTTYDKLNAGDEALTYKIEDGSFSWEKVQAVNVFDHDGPILEYKQSRKGRSQSFVFTHNHRWPVIDYAKNRVYQSADGGVIRRQTKEKSIFINGHQLKSRHSLICRGEYHDDGNSILSERHAAILGWVVTDGYSRWRGNCCEMIVYQSPGKHLKEITELLGKPPRAPHPETGVSAVSVPIEDIKAITKVFRSKAALPSIVTRLSRKAAEAMWDAMFKAEGTTSDRGQQHFCQDPQLNSDVLEAFQILCLMTGRSANLAHAGCTIKRSRAYRINGAISETTYAGKVWCPTTPSGTWVMRHNGAVVVTGNSKSQGVHTAKELATRPGGPMAQTIRATADMQDKDPTTPEYVQQTTSIPLGQLADGSQRYLTGLGLMHEGPLSYLGGGTQGALMQTMSQVNPLIKAPVEWATGESFFQRGPMGGRDLGDLDPTVGRTLSNIGVMTGMMPEGSGPVRFPGQKQAEFILGNSPISRALTTARSLTDTRKSAPAKALNFLTGARVSDISPAAQDAVLRDAAQAYGKEIGAKEFSRVHFSKAQIAELEKTDPRAAQMAAAFNALQKQLSDRQKSRKKKTAGSPQR